MANSDKNILITPNTGESASPKIEVTGADNATKTITINDDGTITFDSTIAATSGSVANGNANLVTGDAVFDYIAAQGFGVGSGDITAVVAGNGLTGGANSGSATVTVGAGTGITVNSGDVAVTAAQTGITSVLNSSLKLGYGASDAYIDFGTDNRIDFSIDNAAQLVLTDGTFRPAGSNDVALGDDAKRWSSVSTVGLSIGATNSSAATMTAILDEDNMASDSATALATQQSIKAYVDSEVSGAGGVSVIGGLTDISMDITNFVDGFLLQTNSDGSAPTTGTLNSATGNIGIGKDVLKTITSADHNVAIGTQAGDSITTGGRNIMIGEFAGEAIDTATDNVIVGARAGRAIHDRTGAIMIGRGAGENAQSSGVVFIGENAGAEATADSFGYNIAIGHDAGEYGANSNASVVIGKSAGKGNSTDTSSPNQMTAVGAFAMTEITTGDDNSAFGYQAMQNITTGSDNIAVGSEALNDVTTGSRNIAIGYRAADGFDTENDNIAIGTAALGGSVAGAEYNVVIGNYAGDAITSADNSVIIGHNAGTAVTTGGENVMIGYQSGYGITDGGSNIFIGQSTGFSGGSNEQGNVAVGHLALSSIANADYNVGVGYRAGRYVKGQHNVYVGYDSGNDSSNTGSKNIGVGYQAGNNITSGSNNVVIGAADVSSATGDSQLSISSGNGGVTWITGTSAGHVSLGNFTFDADQTVGSGQDNYVLTYDNSAGTIGLEAASGGGVSLSGSTNDQLVTVTGSNAIKGESNLTLSSAGALALTGTMTMTDTASDNTTPVLTVEQNRTDNNAMLAKFIGNGNEVLSIRNSGRLHWELSTDGGDSDEVIMSYNDTAGGERNFMQIDQGTVVLNNRGPNGDIEIRANTSTAGSSGEVSVANFQDDRVILNQRTGIGIDAPVNLLHVFGDNSTTNQNSGGAASITIEQDGSGDAALNFLLTGTQRWIMGIDNSDSDKFKIQTGGTSLSLDAGTARQPGFAIDTSGNVGIGTTNPQSTLHITSGNSGDAVLILEADTDNNNETDQPYIVFEQDGGIQNSAVGLTSGNNTDNNALVLSNSVGSSGVEAGIVFKTGASTNGYTNATESMRIYPSGETQARKTRIKAVSSNTTLGDDDSGKTIYWTGGTLTLPATAESGQQFVIINNTNGSATPSLGTSNSIATNWTSHAAMADETARTYIAVAANTWIYIG